MLTSRPATRGEAQSVIGLIPADQLGVTMVHEHLLHDAGCLYAEPSGGSARGRARERMTLRNLAWVRRNGMPSWSATRRASCRSWT